MYTNLLRDNPETIKFYIVESDGIWYSALNELMTDELAKREARGEARGEDRLSRLMNQLLTSNRMEDALRVSSDPVYRKQMLAAFV